MTHPRPAVSARRRRDPAGTRDPLGRAGLELFTPQAYPATTPPQIAARAGIAEGTIYRHFTSKQHLLNELYRAATGRFTKLLRETPPQIPCRERLDAIATAWCGLAAREPAIVRL